MKSYDKKLIAIAGAVVTALFLLLGFLFAQPEDARPLPETPKTEPTTTFRTIELAGSTFRAEVMDTYSKRLQGLSGRDQLGEREAMLFVFDHDDKHCFWMKDMKFSIDIVWFDKDMNYVDMRDDLGPETYPESFCASAPARYAVELPSSTASGTGLESTKLTLN